MKKLSVILSIVFCFILSGICFAEDIKPTPSTPDQELISKILQVNNTRDYIIDHMKKLEEKYKKLDYVKILTTNELRFLESQLDALKLKEVKKGKKKKGKK